MAATHVFKVYDYSGEYVASFKYAGEAANFAEIFAVGGTARWGHSKKHTFWTAGEGTFEGYDDITNQALTFLGQFGINELGFWIVPDDNGSEHMLRNAVSKYGFKTLLEGNQS